MTRCEICNEGPTTTGVSLIRVNALGVEGIWRCHAHATKEQMGARDPIVADIVDIIEKDNAQTELSQLRAEVERLKTQLAEREEDRALLDWKELTRAEYYHSKWHIETKGGKDFEGDTLRAAIRAARAQPEDGK